MTRTHMSQRFLVRSAAVAAVLALGACGSSSTSATTSASTIAVTAAAPTDAETPPLATSGTPTAPETVGSTPTSDDSSATIDTIDTSGTLSPDASPECKELFDLFQPLQGGDATALPSDAALQKAFSSMRAFVPDELKPDVDTSRDAYLKLADAVAAAGGDMKTAISKPEVIQALQALGAPEISAASERVSKYLEQQCPTG